LQSRLENNQPAAGRLISSAHQILHIDALIDREIIARIGGYEAISRVSQDELRIRVLFSAKPPRARIRYGEIFQSISALGNRSIQRQNYARQIFDRPTERRRMKLPADSPISDAETRANFHSARSRSRARALNTRHLFFTDPIFHNAFCDCIIHRDEKSAFPAAL